MDIENAIEVGKKMMWQHQDDKQGIDALQTLIDLAVRYQNVKGMPLIITKEKLIKNKIANALHYYRNTEEPNIEKMVDSLYCLYNAVLQFKMINEGGEMKDRRNKRWCSKHQTVHQTSTYKSCKFPNQTQDKAIPKKPKSPPIEPLIGLDTRGKILNNTTSAIISKQNDIVWKINELIDHIDKEK